METIKLFQQNVYQKRADASITALEHTENGLCLCLNQTIFFPTGGGQSCDVGTIADLHVVEVYEKNGAIYHRCVEKESALSIGDKVDIAIDWSHRFDNMQRHCGEHILSGKFYELFGGVNRGFHMGEDYMTIDISLEENPAYDKVTWDMAKEAELAANQVIWANLPVITRHFDSREEAATLPLRKALALDEDITIVCVGAVENPADCVACCGTHPASAGQVGLLKIYKVEVNKGMYRIYFEAGQRAFRQYQQRFDALSALENRLSAGFTDLLDKFSAQQEKNQGVRNELYQLKKWVIARETAEIKTLLVPAFTRKYDTLSINDLLEIGRGLAGCIPTIAFLVHAPTNTVLLFSDKHDCGRLVKKNANIYGGKGGGNQTSARAIFAKADYVDTFIDLIEKHLR